MAEDNPPARNGSVSLTSLAKRISYVLAAGLAACSGPAPRNEAAPPPVPPADSAIKLTATLLTPHDTLLKWSDPDVNAAGHIVEFATEPQGEYTILGFFTPDTTSYKHPDLMSDTTFYYRVRAFYGPTSNPVEIRLPDSLTPEAYAAAYEKDEDYQWAVPKTIGGDNVPRASIRNAGSAASAGPSDLKATLVPPTISGFQLTWVDHASDEEGFLLERRLNGQPDYTVCATMAADINNFGFALQPPDKVGSFRIRAYYYGKPSNVEHETTGPEAPTP
jgi:hypothetical protein